MRTVDADGVIGADGVHSAVGAILRQRQREIALTRRPVGQKLIQPDLTAMSTDRP
jgi:2-polyprenyl-6-methoxyphenol hydroxylase-like FAD-dependent oxidoreductase